MCSASDLPTVSTWQFHEPKTRALLKTVILASLVASGTHQSVCQAHNGGRLQLGSKTGFSASAWLCVPIISLTKATWRCHSQWQHSFNFKVFLWLDGSPNSKVHGVNMDPIWGRQDPRGSHVWPMNLAIWFAYCKVKSIQLNIPQGLILSTWFNFYPSMDLYIYIYIFNIYDNMLSHNSHSRNPLI